MTSQSEWPHNVNDQTILQISQLRIQQGESRWVIVRTGSA